MKVGYVVRVWGLYGDGAEFVCRWGAVCMSIGCGLYGYSEEWSLCVVEFIFIP